MNDLADFSALDGTFPCIICKGESHRTLLGQHWKCSVCAHVFNEDGSPTDLMCICDKCMKKVEDENAKQSKSLEKVIKKIERAMKKANKKKKTTE